MPHIHHDTDRDRRSKTVATVAVAAIILIMLVMPVAAITFTGPTEHLMPGERGLLDVWISPDGEHMMLLKNDDTLEHYKLQTAHDVDTWSFQEEITVTAESIDLNPTGTQLIWGGIETINRETLSTPYDLSTASPAGSYTIGDDPPYSVGSLALGPRGYNLYVGYDFGGDPETDIYRMSMSSAYDVSTLSVVETVGTIDGSRIEPTGIDVGYGGDHIFIYNTLGTPSKAIYADIPNGDLSSLSVVDSWNVNEGHNGGIVYDGGATVGFAGSSAGNPTIDTYAIDPAFDGWGGDDIPDPTPTETEMDTTTTESDTETETDTETFVEPPTGTETAVWEDVYQFDAPSYLAHNTSGEYEVTYGENDVTDAASVTSGNTTLITVNDAENTLVATSDVNVSGVATVTAEYLAPDGDLHVASANVTVANATTDNLEILPPWWRVNAVMLDSTVQAILVAIMLAVAGTRFSTSFGGLSIGVLTMTIAWFAGFVDTGIFLIAIVTAAFLGLNLAANMDLIMGGDRIT